jgi:hypothetical protein
MNDIFCFGDGYASGHIWPEWPDIIAVLNPEYNVTNFGAIGAGNEFILNEIIKAHRSNPSAFFVVQWATSKRFDKLLEDESWNKLIETDPVYDFNIVTRNDERWWLSSASSLVEISEYHGKYVQANQASVRTENFQYLINHLLKDQSFVFSTKELENFSRQPRFANSRLSEIQPSPVVHMAYVEEVILPQLPKSVDSDKVQILKQKISDQPWIPYHWDRQKIWQDLANSL